MAAGGTSASSREASTALRAGCTEKGHPKIGTAFVHTVIDGHSRVAYAEIHTDEKAITAAAVLYRAVSWFTDHGVSAKRVLSDSGSAYQSYLWRDTCTELGRAATRTRPYRPQTNGKIARFHRTRGDGWAHPKWDESTTQPDEALPVWLQFFYNHHRAHTALGGKPPVTRLTDLPDITPHRGAGLGHAAPIADVAPGSGREGLFRPMPGPSSAARAAPWGQTRAPSGRRNHSQPLERWTRPAPHVTAGQPRPFGGSDASACAVLNAEEAPSVWRGPLLELKIRLRARRPSSRCPTCGSRPGSCG